jgi:hypothetical protein
MIDLKIQNFRQQKGSSIVETLAGSFIIIPIILFFLDVTGCVLSQMANDHMCKDIARQIAEMTPPVGTPFSDGVMQPLATTKAQAVYNQYVDSGSMLITDSGTAPSVIYDATNGSGVHSGVVSVQTTVKCNFLVPLAGFSSVNFTSAASEPIVANLPTQ